MTRLVFSRWGNLMADFVRMTRCMFLVVDTMFMMLMII